MNKNGNNAGVTAEDFYSLMGKMTLIHAGIEYDIKHVLTEDWGVSEHEVSKKCGVQLRKLFFKTIKTKGITDNYYAGYEQIMKHFWSASEKRNELLKASYSLVKNTQKVYRHNNKEREEFDPNTMDVYDWTMTGGRVITYEELQTLIGELSYIREAYFQLSKRVFLEKRMLQKSA